MFKNPIFRNLSITALIFSFFVSGCGFKDRDDTEENKTATTTSITIDGVEGPRSLDFHAPLEIDAIGENPLWFQIADFNNDQRNDIILLNSEDNVDTQGFHILTRTSENSVTDFNVLFDINTRITVETSYPSHSMISDLDKNGILDLVLVHPQDDKLRIWKRTNINESYSTANLVEVDVGDFPAYITPYRQTGAVVVNRGSREVMIFLDLNSLEKIVIDSSAQLGEDPIQAVVGDWNEDGCDDIAILSRETERVDFYECANFQSDDTLTFESFGDQSVGSAPQGLIAGDWDNDNHLDLAISNSDDDSIMLLYGDGSGNFDSRILDVGQSPRQLAATDFNDDQIIDFIVGNTGDGDLSILLSNGKGSRPSDSHSTYGIGDVAIGSIPTGSNPSYIHVTDMDNDGRADILTTLPFENKLSILFQK